MVRVAHALSLAGAILGMLVLVAGVQAQGGRTYRVASVSTLSHADARPYNEAFLATMRELGYAEGRNLVLAQRFADGQSRLVPLLVDEMIALKPDVLIGWENVAVVMRARTTSIPIVLTGGIDPVGSGLAQNLARPGMNVTGVAQLNYLLVEKHIDMMREIDPGFARVGLLVDPSHRPCKLIEENARQAAQKVGATVVPYAVGSREELESAFARMAETPPGMLIPCPSPVMQNLRELMIDNVLRLRIPFTSFIVETVRKGVLFSYAESGMERMRVAAKYVDKILKGAKPGDLPIEQPTRLELVINLQTAQALGLRVPLSVLLRADRVIE